MLTLGPSQQHSRATGRHRAQSLPSSAPAVQGTPSARPSLCGLFDAARYVQRPKPLRGPSSRRREAVRLSGPPVRGPCICGTLHRLAAQARDRCGSIHLAWERVPAMIGMYTGRRATGLAVPIQPPLFTKRSVHEVWGAAHPSRRRGARVLHRSWTWRRGCLCRAARVRRGQARHRMARGPAAPEVRA
jgi:hypothetical protein